MCRAAAIATLVLALAAGAGATTPAPDAPPIPDDAPYAVVKINLAGYDETARLYEIGGTLWYVLYADDGRALTVTPDAFSRMVHAQQSGRSWWLSFLNISSPIGIVWVLVGLLGQLLFTGRMLVQWLVSEKEKRSVVPPAFWWMSLIGATMLLVYFVWRKDVVGVLGQATGWFIYVRNLYFIHRPARDTDDPAPEPELAE